MHGGHEMKCPALLLGSLRLVALVSCGCVSPLAAQAPETEVPLRLDSPRATMRTFLVSVNDDKLEEAITCLDFAGTQYSSPEKEQLARRLKAIIDRMAWVDYAKIPNRPESGAYTFPPDAVEQPVIIARAEDGTWRFSTDTVACIDVLYEAWKDKPRIVSEKPHGIVT